VSYNHLFLGEKQYRRPKLHRDPKIDLQDGDQTPKIDLQDGNQTPKIDLQDGNQTGLIPKIGGRPTMLGSGRVPLFEECKILTLTLTLTLTPNNVQGV